MTSHEGSGDVTLPSKISNAKAHLFGCPSNGQEKTMSGMYSNS